MTQWARAFKLESISLWRVTVPVKQKASSIQIKNSGKKIVFCFTGTVTLHKEIPSNSAVYFEHPFQTRLQAMSYSI